MINNIKELLKVLDAELKGTFTEHFEEDIKQGHSIDDIITVFFECLEIWKEEEETREIYINFETELKKISLSKKIGDYLNEVNNFTFTSWEMEEEYNNILCMIEEGDTETIINSLNEEYKNSQDKEVLKMIMDLKGIKVL